MIVNKQKELVSRFKIYINKLKLGWRRFPYRKLITTLVMLIGIPAGVLIISRPVFLRSFAAGETIQISIEPSTQILPPDAVFQVYINAESNQIAFVRTVISFDPAKMQLTQDVALNDFLTTVIKKTSYSDANLTGRIELVLALTPGDSAPTGIFQFAEFTLTSISLVDNDATIVSVDNTDIQIVDINAQVLSGSINPSSLTLNPVAPTATLTPTQAPSSTNTPTTTVTNTPTPTQALSPTPTGVVSTPSATIALTSTPTSTSTPTNIPSSTPTEIAYTSTPVATLTPTVVPTLPPINFSPSPTPTSSPSQPSQPSSQTSQPSQPSAPSAPSDSGTPRKKGDINGDGKVNVFDLSILLSKFAKKEGGAFDLNNDNTVNILDLSILLSNWGK